MYKYGADDDGGDDIFCGSYFFIASRHVGSGQPHVQCLSTNIYDPRMSLHLVMLDHIVDYIIATAADDCINVMLDVLETLSSNQHCNVTCNISGAP